MVCFYSFFFPVSTREAAAADARVSTASRKGLKGGGRQQENDETTKRVTLFT